MILVKVQIIKLLEYFKIRYWTSGNNVMPSSVNINCPFCNDPSNHLCLFENEDNGYCWRCDDSYSHYKIFHEINGITYSSFNDLVRKVGFSTEKVVVSEKEIVKEKPASLPKEYIAIDDTAPNYILEYLIQRNVSLQTCIDNKFGYCTVGEYKYRIIIPIYYKNKLVAFQARDATGRAISKYLTSRGSVNNYLYKYDDLCGSTIIIVEGVFDALRIKNSVATFGISMSTQQRRLVVDRKPSELIFCWDSGAYVKARKHAEWFLPFVSNIKVVLFPEKEDPDSYGCAKTSILIDKASYM